MAVGWGRISVGCHGDGMGWERGSVMEEEGKSVEDMGGGWRGSENEGKRYYIGVRWEASKEVEDVIEVKELKG